MSTIELLQYPIGTLADMSEAQDAKRLAGLLHRLQEVSIRRTGDPSKPIETTNEVESIRGECLELVDRYFRQTLRPALAARFPEKGIQSAPVAESAYSNDVMFRYTELVNDFFVQVLSNFDDPFWKKNSAIELRNYASIVISNHGVRDALRKRKKQQAIGESAVHATFEEQLAAEIETRFSNDEQNLDPAEAMELLHRWEASDDEKLRRDARLLRLFYVCGMKVEDIAEDMKTPLKTAYRWKAAALKKMRQQLVA